MKGLVLSLFFLALSAAGARAQAVSCPASRTIVDIPGSANPVTRMCLRDLLIDAVQKPNTVVRMGPDVDFDFTDVKSLPIEIGRCTTLTSVSAFAAPVRNACTGAANARVSPEPALARRNDLRGVTATAAGGRGSLAFGPPVAAPSARSSHSPGPVLRSGNHPDLSDDTAFFQSGCGGGLDNDGVRLSGFRLFGPSFGDQTRNDAGFRVDGCLDAEVSNMEVAGWGGAGIEARNLNLTGIPDTMPNPVTVLIHDSYFHDNRHPTVGGSIWDLYTKGHAEGYGVTTGAGGWSRIYNNVFDNNRHAIAAAGQAGGYQAEHNLILKGGGYHGAWYEAFTHVIDAHGTGCSAQCGDAGRSFLIKENVVQYRRNSDIHIRGRPRGLATIDNNIFARSDQGAAVALQSLENVDLKHNNHYNVDSFGLYDAQCDFDGDGVDDLFFATGVTWWFSGQGRFPWTFLATNSLPRQQLRFGYFDGGPRCDVAVELPSGSGQWFISKGGVTDPVSTPLANLGHPANQIVFGRFNPSVRDHRPGATRQTTDAFWRRDDGQWFVTSLKKIVWTPVESSGFPMSQLRFGDFTGDGVTDVLAVVNGRWSISESARGTWRTLNPTLGEPVGNLYIANMDTDDNIDDILKLDRSYTEISGLVVAKLTWWRSKNGVEPWKVWKTYTFQYSATDDGYVPVGFGFAGRLGPGAGQGATMIIDQNRMGQFTGGGGFVNWQSGFPY